MSSTAPVSDVMVTAPAAVGPLAPTVTTICVADSDTTVSTATPAMATLATEAP